MAQAQAISEGRESIRTPGGEGEIIAVSGENLGEGGADSGRCAGD
jgi:hypothetical protein